MNKKATNRSWFQRTSPSAVQSRTWLTCFDCLRAIRLSSRRPLLSNCPPFEMWWHWGELFCLIHFYFKENYSFLFYFSQRSTNAYLAPIKATISPGLTIPFKSLRISFDSKPLLHLAVMGGFGVTFRFRQETVTCSDDDDLGECISRRISLVLAIFSLFYFTR